jgi:hypothetical protein
MNQARLEQLRQLASDGDAEALVLMQREDRRRGVYTILGDYNPTTPPTPPTYRSNRTMAWAFLNAPARGIAGFEKINTDVGYSQDHLHNDAVSIVWARGEHLRLDRFRETFFPIARWGVGPRNKAMEPELGIYFAMSTDTWTTASFIPGIPQPLYSIDPRHDPNILFIPLSIMLNSSRQPVTWSAGAAVERWDLLCTLEWDAKADLKNHYYALSTFENPRKKVSAFVLCIQGDEWFPVGLL